MTLRTCVAWTTAVVSGLLTAGCARGPESQDTGVLSAGQAIAGVVTIEGSSTLFPVSRTLADRFENAHPGARIMPVSSSTADGLNKLCAGQIDIAAASRPINMAEITACAQHDIEFVEVPVAFDTLSVVVSSMNSFVDCLTTAELRRIWEPDAQGKVMRWSDVRSSFPAVPLTLIGPGSTSGTYDYFTLAVNGAQGRSRADYTKSDDDDLLANAVADAPGALGYFGYAYYVRNRERLKVVGIDNGGECVTPGAQTVVGETYEPLSRPLFMYASLSALSRPEVDAFARFVVSGDQVTAIENAGYVALPVVTLLTTTTHLDERVTGSIFGGRGAILGVTANSFAADERVKNALVR